MVCKASRSRRPSELWQTLLPQTHEADLEGGEWVHVLHTHKRCIPGVNEVYE